MYVDVSKPVGEKFEKKLLVFSVVKAFEPEVN